LVSIISSGGAPGRPETRVDREEMCDSVGKLLRNGVRGRSAVAAREKQANKGGMITYLDPALFLHLGRVIFDLGAVNCHPLARRGEIVGAADGRSLPVLHLGKRGRTRRGSW